MDDSEVKIVQYFKENEREMRWINDDKELIVFLYGFDMEDFGKLVEEVAHDIGSDGGWNIVMTTGFTTHYCVTISDLCEYIGMNPELILTKKDGEANC